MKTRNSEVCVNANRLAKYYAPLFAEHGVVLDYQLRRFKQFAPSGRDYEQRRIDKVMHNIGQWFRTLFTGKKAEPYRGEEDTAEVWSLILTFSTADNKAGKDYSLAYRVHVRNEKNSIRSKRLFKQAERLVKRKLRQAAKLGADCFCEESWWDVLRYVFGNYGYKRTVKGVSLTLIHIFLFTAVSLLFLILDLVFLS